MSDSKKKFEEMKNDIPTLEEVKEYFKNAKEVECLVDEEVYDISCLNRSFHWYDEGAWVTNDNDVDILLWDDGKYAEIISYKEDKPKQYQIGIDTFQRAESNMTLEERLACVRWNIDKYNWRKKDQDKQDFEKIKAYCDYAIKQLENK